MLSGILKPYIVAIVPIFLAIDIIGTVPIFLSLTEELNKKQKNKIISDSVIIATILAVAFVFIGKIVFSVLGITMYDFKIAGGILLFILSIYLLLPGISKDFLTRAFYEDLGIFPLATPLITGPAVLVTVVMLAEGLGFVITLTALVINMCFVWLVLKTSHIVIRIIGHAGVKALSKISYIFLAAIGVMIARQGIIGIIQTF